MNIVAKSDKGMVRTTNQDAYAVSEANNSFAWAVVCDGMGGAAGGNVASRLAVDVISEKIRAAFNENMRDSSIRNLLECAISAANVEVYDMANKNEELQGMGTTVVCTVIKNNQAIIAHAGDSRAYLLADDNLQQITIDHSLVQSLVDQGKITKEEAFNHPNKNLITRALGTDENIEVDFDEIEVNEGNVVLLCSDGLSNFVTDEDIIDNYKNEDFETFADRLVDIANENGGRDNITIAAISI